MDDTTAAKEAKQKTAHTPGDVMTTHHVALTVTYERHADSEDARTYAFDVTADVTFDQWDDASVVLVACEPLPDEFAMLRIDEDVIAAALAARRTAWKVCSCGHVYATRADYERETRFIGIQGFGGHAPPCALRNCPTCRTTYADPVPFVLDDRANLALATTPRRPDDIPCVVHSAPYGRWTATGVEMQHVCGVTAERGVTQTVGPSGANDNGTYTRARAVNCPSCLEERERHSAACAAVRSGR